MEEFSSYFLIFLFVFGVSGEEEDGLKYATKCEVCQIVTRELQHKLEETGKTHSMIETGYKFDSATKKRKKYAKSELRLVETLEDICEVMLSYNIHKERTDSTRFAKSMSQTFKTLHGLKNKGVKVELGIPYELWDKPSAEVTNLKTQCEKFLEDNEYLIEDWYQNHQDTSALSSYLCLDRVLTKDESQCFFDHVADSKLESKSEL